MPSMDWETFQHDHHRPHLIVVSRDVGAKRDLFVAKVDLERLAVTLGASGNFALKSEGRTIYVAFESDLDAARFAAVLRPIETTRDREWASKTLARMDAGAYRRIAATLKQSTLKTVRKR